MASPAWRCATQQSGTTGEELAARAPYRPAILRESRSNELGVEFDSKLIALPGPDATVLKLHAGHGGDGEPLLGYAGSLSGAADYGGGWMDGVHWDEDEDVTRVGDMAKATISSGTSSYCVMNNFSVSVSRAVDARRRMVFARLRSPHFLKWARVLLSSGVPSLGKNCNLVSRGEVCEHKRMMPLRGVSTWALRPSAWEAGYGSPTVIRREAEAGDSELTVRFTGNAALAGRGDVARTHGFVGVNGRVRGLVVRIAHSYALGTALGRGFRRGGYLLYVGGAVGWSGCCVIERVDERVRFARWIVVDAPREEQWVCDGGLDGRTIATGYGVRVSRRGLANVSLGTGVRVGGARAPLVRGRVVGGGRVGLDGIPLSRSGSGLSLGLCLVCTEGEAGVMGGLPVTAVKSVLNERTERRVENNATLSLGLHR
ncbi:hypothetical protein C8R46DRAFT_1043466 [Mycena filopes]|nr:hypothetical protein C8R46DRAFT_1043466 [Mycena filopes]